MLVKRSIVETWYQRDSWVFKNFSYLFQNPLWDKRIPRGFSVCPYFWLSLFSLFIFRPFFIFPIRYLIIPLFKLIGKPAYALDHQCGNLLRWIFQENDVYPPPMGTLLCVLGLILLSGICFGAVKLGEGIYHFYPYISKASALGTFTFWGISSFISLFAIIFLHKKITKTECKTMNYLYVWLLLFLISSFIFVPGELLRGSSIVLTTIWTKLSSACVIVIKSIWIALVFIAKYIWIALSWKLLFLPWIVIVLGLTVIAYLADRIMFYFEQRSNEKFMSQQGSEFWNRNRERWLTVFTQAITTSQDWDNGTVFANEDGHETIIGFLPNSKNPYEHEAYRTFRYTLYRKAVEFMLGDDLVKYQERYPLVPGDKMSELRNKIWSITGKFYLLAQALGIGKEYTRADFQAAISRASKDPVIRSLVEPLADRLMRDDEAKQKKKESKSHSWMHQKCLQFTGSLNRGACCVGRGIKTLAVQFWTLIVYLWMLVKAKKQGACPYFQFTDPNKNINSK